MIFNSLQNFDEVTRFRLINSFIVAIGMNLFWPILIDLKGEYLVAWVISSFMIAETLMIKTNRWMVETFSIGQLYKLSVLFHIAFTLTACTYFIAPLFMILTDSVLAIFDVVVFSAYSIMLNNYLTDNYPESMKEFQIIRNSVWADGTLIGLGIITLVTFIFSQAVGLMVFILFNLLFSLWLLKNWNFFKHALR